MPVVPFVRLLLVASLSAPFALACSAPASTDSVDLAEAPSLVAPDAGEPEASTPTQAEPIFCGGLAGRVCPAGYECVDIPDDRCDPSNGGRDCLGRCLEPAS
jgi:hypothetical protein